MFFCNRLCKMNYKLLIFSMVYVAMLDSTWGGESVSYEQFSNFSLVEQKSVLEKAFSERISHARNLYFRITMEDIIRKNDNGKEGEIIGSPSPGTIHSHWQLDKDYKVIREAYLRDRSAPPQVSYNYWDAREGVLRGTFRSEDIPGHVFGRIDSQYNPVLAENRCFVFLLQGGGADDRVYDLYLFPHLLEYKSGWNIVCLSEESKVQLSFDFEPKDLFFKDGGTGKRTLLLDPDKNFMPVRGELRYDKKFFDGRLFWHEDSFYVEESLMVGHVWMPTKLKFVTQLSHPDDNFNIKKVIVTDISHGTVTKADVTLKFPEGTEVVDAINGISYKTDARGNPIESTIEPLYDFDPSHSSMQLPEPPDRTLNWVLMVVGIVMIIVGLYIHLKKRYVT